MSKKKRLTLLIVAVIILATGGFAAYRLLKDTKTAIVPSAGKTVAEQKKDTTPNQLVFAAMGDQLAHDSVVAQAKTGSTYDFTPYFTAIRPLYATADVVFCNPETIAAGEQLGVSGYPTFNAPNEFARDLVKGAGCNLINLASNHTNDKHQAGIDANLDVWTKLPILAYSGSNRSAKEQQTIHYFTKNGIKVAFLAYSDYSNDTNLTSYGLNIYHNDTLFSSQLKEARANADAVIVSMHWGTEDSGTVNSDQIASAQRAADLGADVVIGTGPHVLQKTVWLNGANGKRTLVWYSIGNMLSSQLAINELTGGIAGFTLVKETNGVKVEDPTLKATFMSYDWPAADRAAEKLTTRSNLKLQPLADATGKPEAMFGSSYSVSERTKYVHNAIGTDGGVTFTP
jgi:poly-gamma-glutamate synthesis protein (capsule biosynthesis protein)